MLLPGYSSNVVPANIRLFVAVAISLSLSPSLLPDILPIVRASGDDMRLQLIFTELLNGAMIGTLGRIFMIALNFAGNVAANSIGMGQAIGATIDETEATPAIVDADHADGDGPVLRAEPPRRGPEGDPRLLSHHAGGRRLRRAQQPRPDHRQSRRDVPALPAHREPLHRLCRHRQLRDRPHEQDDAADPGLLHLAALRDRGRMMLLGVSVGDFLRIFMQNYQIWVLGG